MKSLFFLLSVCLLTAFAGCGSPSNTAPYPSNVTPSPSNTIPYPTDILVIVEPTVNDPEGKIVIDSITIAAGTLDRDYMAVRGLYAAGLPCFLVSGHIVNGYGENCWVAYHIEGFDASGNRISSTLDTGPLPGWGQVYLASYSSADFTLHLSWSDYVTLMTVSSHRTIRVTPSPTLIANITITINPCIDDREGKIVIDNITIAAGTLDREYMSLHGDFIPGDPCWLVSGRISNGYDEDYWVAYHAEGYDASGNQVSFTLDAGPILGVDQVFISGNSSENFTLHLKYSDNVTSITLSSQMWNQMFP
jgi:hypothetical protein